jgi:hypothetical protein
MSLQKQAEQVLLLDSPAAIIDSLHFSSGVPCEAILAARGRKEEMTPLLLAIIEDFNVCRGRTRWGDDALFLALHLLGEWKETKAYHPILRMLHLPDIILDRVFGDALTETVYRVLASVYDGNPKPLYDVVLNEKIDAFMRWNMFSTMIVLVLDGRLDKQEATFFLREAFEKIKPQKNNPIWAGWLDAVASLGLDDLRPLAKEVFVHELIPERMMDYSHFEEDLDWVLANPGKINPKSGGESRKVFGDVIEEFSNVKTFNDEYDIKFRAALERMAQRGIIGDNSFSEPVTNLNRRIGRNDPCPCGSEKKYKKCCLAS